MVALGGLKRLRAHVAFGLNKHKRWTNHEVQSFSHSLSGLSRYGVILNRRQLQTLRKSSLPKVHINSAPWASPPWPVSAGGILELPWRGQLTWYAMEQLRVYVPTGATVTVVYAD